MTETELQRAVVGLAHTFGFRAMHTRPVLVRGRWVTPIQGDAGFPDLVLCGRGRVMFRELKAGHNRRSPEQVTWGEVLTAAGADYAVWSPDDWPEPILSQLSTHQRQQATLVDRLLAGEI